MFNGLNFPKFGKRHKFKDSRSLANPKRIENKTLKISQTAENQI